MSITEIFVIVISFNALALTFMFAAYMSRQRKVNRAALETLLEIRDLVQSRAGEGPDLEA